MPGDEGAGEGEDWRSVPPSAELPTEVQTFLQALRLYMSRTDSSLRAFAKTYKYDPGTVSRYLNGQRAASGPFVRDLLAAVEAAGHEVRECDRTQLEHLHRRVLSHPRGAASKALLKAEFAKVSEDLAQQAHNLEEITAALTLARIEVTDHKERIRQLGESLALKQRDIRDLEEKLAEYTARGNDPEELRRITGSYEQTRAEADALRAELTRTRALLLEAEQRLRDSELGMAGIAEAFGRERRVLENAHRSQIRELESRMRALQEAADRRAEAGARNPSSLDASTPADLRIDPRLQNERVGAELRHLHVLAHTPAFDDVSAWASVPRSDVSRMFIHDEIRDGEKLRAIASVLAKRAGRAEAVQEIMDLWEAGRTAAEDSSPSEEPSRTRGFQRLRGRWRNG
ncbi:helix-turn-helix domain-containing protein [Streptomyces sp. NPDC050418]|uniref:helix-turn-helix domain-containing protein n=1 Tax=Streptomyces sp. NPDC050418 TaxID=3365612 RepID=UPI0037B77872